MDLDTALHTALVDDDIKKHCHVNSNEDGDRFVGIKADSDNAMVYFPIGYQLPETDNEIRTDIKHLIQVLSEFTTSEDRLIAVNKFAAPQSVDFPINAYKNVIEYYFSIGGKYYIEVEPTFKTSANQDKETIIINESGLYSLILSSKMPNAKKFKHWVTAEVLPAIRKHGMYAIDEILENPDLAIAALTQLKEERERRKQLECLALVQRQQIAEMQPKASYYDLILQNKNTVPITQIAKDYGMSGRKFNELLHELGVQYKFRKTWLLYQQYAECGYTQSRTYAIDESRSVMHTYWTQKGRLFLYDLLKNEGILPVIEQED